MPPAPWQLPWLRLHQEVAEVRAKVPVNVHQVSFNAPQAPTASDPLVRFFGAIRPDPVISRGATEETHGA